MDYFKLVQMEIWLHLLLLARSTLSILREILSILFLLPGRRNIRRRSFRIRILVLEGSSWTLARKIQLSRVLYILSHRRSTWHILLHYLLLMILGLLYIFLILLLIILWYWLFSATFKVCCLEL